jgi:predicted outer membrane repeat protein
MKSTPRIKCLSLLMLMFLLAIGCGKDKATSPELTGPKVIQVRPDGTGDYPTIQAAIDKAANREIIELADGTFTGDGNWDIDYHGKAITVRSQSNNYFKCFIDCYDSKTTSSHRGFYFDSGEGPNSVLQGVMVRYGNAPEGRGGAVFCGQNCSPKFINCFFRGSSADQGGGMCCDRSSPSLTDCYFEDNRASYGGGLYCSNATPSIANCTFSSNKATNGKGIYLSRSSPHITHCTFKWNEWLSHVGCGAGLSCSFSVTVLTPFGAVRKIHLPS